MKIGIIGTRGIPNYYGGFEQFAEFLSKYLVQKGHEVIVYNSHNHPYQEKIWNGVSIIHKYDPEKSIGTAGQFFYDLNCILDSRKRKFDIILQLGYTSSSIWSVFFPSKSKIITNMDGLEWKRTKYSKLVQRFLLFAESLGVRKSDHLIADSIGIQDYLLKKYNAKSTYIPYGSNVATNFSEHFLSNYDVEPYKYSMLVARLEPENSIELILDGKCLSEDQDPFLVVGNHKTSYGSYLKEKYLQNNRIKFVGGVYDIDFLNSLRFYSKLYFHGHTVGGTNPSLLEAMGSGACICAHHNIFNKSILGDDALYFSNSSEVALYLNRGIIENRELFVSNNTQKILKQFNWDSIVNQYEQIFKQVLDGNEG